MASTTAITTSASDSASVKAEPSSPATTTPPTTNDTKTSDAALAPNANANGGQAPAPKRRAARRANTAERRATHNAVERMRRETLNGRFLVSISFFPVPPTFFYFVISPLVGSVFAGAHPLFFREAVR
jgi:hypothetical protein